MSDLKRSVDYYRGTGPRNSPESGRIVEMSAAEMEVLTRISRAPTDGLEATLAERGARYGDFADRAVVAQAIQDAMRKPAGWEKLPAMHKQALTVIADKIARMLTGDPMYMDSVRDIAGYATLVLQRMDVEGATDSQTVSVKKVGGEWQRQ